MEEEAAQKPIRCIVKLGGAAISRKNKLETINEEGLKIVAQQLREATKVLSGVSEKVLGMDWSKRPGSEEISCDADGFTNKENSDFNPFIVVHGAGSFGHFQASKSGVHKGGINLPLVKAGFVATRISVTSLNLEIVRALAREGIPSLGMSPFACGWLTSKRNIVTADISIVAKAIESGFVPVLHGDAVFDVAQGCTILSGDVIISHLAAQLKPDFVVFLYEPVKDICHYVLAFWDVLGVYDRPPTEPDAVLLREIEVSEDGSWTVVEPNMNKQVEMTVAAHDTTGGMATKISEAANIAILGIDVYIVKAATSHSLKALRGELIGNIPDNWLGTIIRLKR